MAALLRAGSSKLHSSVFIRQSWWLELAGRQMPTRTRACLRPRIDTRVHDCIHTCRH